MDLGIGLPNAVPGTSGDQLIDFAREADQAGFSALGTGPLSDRWWICPGVVRACRQIRGGLDPGRLRP